MTYHWTIPLFAALANLVLAFVVYRTGERTSTARAFTVLALTMVFWNLNFFVMYWASDPVMAFRVTRGLRAVAMLLPPAILHLSVALSDERGSRGWRIVAVDYAFGGVLFVANCFDLLVSGLGQFAWGFYSIGTPLYNVFTFYLVANCIAAAGLMLYKYRHATEPRVWLQLKFWLFGSAVAIPLGLTNLLPAYGVPIYPLGSLGSAVFSGIVAYAIVRHRLMDIDLVLTKGVSYAIVSLILIVPAFCIALWLQQVSFGQVHTDFSFVLLIMLLAVGVFFPTLRLRTQMRLERSLFPDKHQHRGALMNFTRSIVRILDRDRLIAALADTLSDAFEVDRLAIALRSDGQGVFLVCRTIGIPPATGELAADDPFVQSLSRRQEVVLRDELEMSEDASERVDASGVCRTNGWEAGVPLTAGNKLIGFISLGRKRDLSPFYVEDLALLGTVAAEASVALENARLYEELKKSQDIIRRADRLSALGTLAAGIAHEIRNPLVSIQTFFQLAPQRLNDQEFLTEFLSLTSGEVKRITDLISELLSFARSPNPATTDVDLNVLVDGVARLIEPQLRTRQIEVVRNFAAELPPTRADRDQLKQVLLNIMLNAAQAMGNGGEIRLASRAITIQEQPFCQIEVSDTGPGIPAEIIDDIFNPFFTTKDKGTGLGLAISNQVISEHGGFISVESEVGRGTTFRIHLRQTVSQDSREPRDVQVDVAQRKVSGVRPRYD